MPVSRWPWSPSSSVSVGSWLSRAQTVEELREREEPYSPEVMPQSERKEREKKKWVRECHCLGILSPKQQNLKLDSKATNKYKPDGISTCLTLSFLG